MKLDGTGSWFEVMLCTVRPQVREEALNKLIFRLICY